jgi:hypothetical protein
MHEVYSDDYASVVAGDSDRLVSGNARRLAGAVVFLALVGVMGVWAYRLGTRDATQVPVIRSMEGPARIKPDDPGGLQADHQGLEVNSVLAGLPAPVPRRIDARTEPVTLQAEDAPQRELAEIAAQVETEASNAQAEDLALQVVSSLNRSAAPAPETDEAALADLGAPRLRPLRRPGPVAAAVNATPKPIIPAEVRTAGVPDVSTPGLGAGARLVQLGAFDSEELTRQAWAQLQASNGDLLGSKTLYVERTTANARVFYRLRVAGFSDREQTREMCEALRGRGVDCIPVTLQ